MRAGVQHRGHLQRRAVLGPGHPHPGDRSAHRRHRPPGHRPQAVRHPGRDPPSRSHPGRPQPGHLRRGAGPHERGDGGVVAGGGDLSVALRFQRIIRSAGIHGGLRMVHDSSAPPSTPASPTALIPGARRSPCTPSGPARRRPRLLAAATPSRVRSEIGRRSKCAMAPKTWNTSSPGAQRFPFNNAEDFAFFG